MSAVSAEDITAHMNLHEITDRIWQIQACSAKTGDGLQEGLELRVGGKRDVRHGMAGGARGGEGWMSDRVDDVRVGSELRSAQGWLQPEAAAPYDWFH